MPVTIYSLSCPISNEIKYIGATSKPLKIRLSGHLSEKAKSRKCLWINKLKAGGLIPAIEEIEVVRKIDKDNAEEYWIGQFQSWGFDLCNETYYKRAKRPSRAKFTVKRDVRLNKKENDILIKLAKRERRSKSYILRKVVSEYIERHENK